MQSPALGLIGALFGTVALHLFTFAMSVSVLRNILLRFLPQSGEGPSDDILDNGFFKCKLWGSGVNQETGKKVIIKGSVEALHGDPGYRQTAKMVAESAVCLALDGPKLPPSVGILTPASAMGKVLRERLCDKGIHFVVEK